MKRDLDQVSETYRRWRSRSKSGRVPQSLKKEITYLSHAHSLSELTKRFGVPLKTLERWCAPPQESSEAVIDFIDLPVSKALASPAVPKCTLTSTFEMPGGIKLILDGQTPADLVQFIGLLAERMTP